MKLVGIMPVRNESWCLGLTLRALLAWVDHVILLNHASTDSTQQIINEVACEHPGRVGVIFDRSSHEWNEMEQRGRLLACARIAYPGRAHIIILDADEIVTGNLILDIRRLVEQLRPGAIMRLPGYNLRAGIHQYHANGIWAHRWFSAAFRDDPRLGWSGDCLHHREPSGAPLEPWQPVAQRAGGIMHLWGASERRLRAKHAWYRITERLRWTNKSAKDIEAIYSPATDGDWRGRVAGWTYATVPQSWWAPYGHLMQHLDLDAEPWQEAESRRLVEQYGRERFAGLDLLGVA